jgi:hypothetical protein
MAVGLAQPTRIAEHAATTTSSLSEKKWGRIRNSFTVLQISGIGPVLLL